MSNIPDFVLQIQEAERNLRARWKVTQNDWRGGAADSYNENVMEPYFRYFYRYVKGEDLKGYGVDELMKQMDKHMKDMEEITGIPANFSFSCAAGTQHNGGIQNWFDQEIAVENSKDIIDRGGFVHDRNRDRDYWNTNSMDDGYDGPKPGELQDKDIMNIMEQKQ